MKLASKIFKRNDWYVTSPFGNREPIKTKNGISSDFHSGCDYGTNRQKWSQYAIEDGIVTSCGVASDGAKYIWVDYPRINKKLLHYHLDSILVNSGQLVDENTILGYTGMTGKATGIHLHLGMKDSNGGEYQDPDAYDYQPVSKIVVTNSNSSKSIIDIAYEVIAGKYGNGTERIQKLEEKGYDAKEVQDMVNAIRGNKRESTQEYTVVKGDTLEKIAKKFNTTWDKIYELNKNVIGDNPNLIKIGQKLKV